MSSSILSRAAATLLALVAACTATADVGLLESDSEIPSKLDLLLVIDSSSSMSKEQESMLANFQKLIGQLETLPAGLPSLHLAVISADVGIGRDLAVDACDESGDNGRFQSNSLDGEPCIGPGENFARNLRVDDGTRIRNYDEPLLDRVACMGNLGIDGCGFEQPLEAIKRALDGRNPENANFLRDDALLALVILTDEDDCSASSPELFEESELTFGPLSGFRCAQFGLECDGESVDPTPGKSYNSCEPSQSESGVQHPDTYVEYLEALKGSRDKVMVSVIAGDVLGLTIDGRIVNGQTQPFVSSTCASDNGEAQPAHRLSYFARQFKHSAVTSICDADLSDALLVIGEMIVTGFSPPDQTVIVSNASGCNGSGARGSAFAVLFLLLLCGASRSFCERIF